MNNPDNTIEYNSLSWVKAQLDDVLADAQSNLNDYIENKSEDSLENCIEHLQLIYGTLQMVEVYGASMLAEEMQLTTTALLQGNVERAENAYDVLMRAMLQLPDYLEGIQAGKKDAPITLMPLINDLRAARKEGLLTESVLFSPDIENAVIPSHGYDASTIEAGKLQGEVKRLRTHYQLGLLDIIRNKKEKVGLQRIKAVLSSLEKVSSNTQVRNLWMSAGALVDGLLKKGIEINISIEMLLGGVDRQLKLILDVGEESFADQYSKEVVKNVLYYVGLCEIDSPQIKAVKEAYNLSDLIHKETEEEAASIGGLNADLFDTVSKGITEDLAQVKDVLELFMTSSEKDLEQLVPVSEQLGKIADTYGMLSMGAVRQGIMDQRDVLESIIKGDTEISEQVVLGIASELLNAESELKDYIAERSGFVDMNRKDDDQAVPASEYRQVVFTVVSEGLKNFSEAKEAILSYVSGIGDKDQLEIILNRLEEVRGVSMMLPMGRIEALIQKLQAYIRTALLNNNHQPDLEEQDTVADVVTSIEYFFEALSEGRPGVEQGLNAGDEAAEKLVEITQRYGDSVAAAEPAVEEAAVEEDVVEEPAVELSESDEGLAEVIPLDIAEEAEVAPAEEAVEAVQPATSEEEEEQYNILADDADEEIVEIFIEEAVEVLEELHTYLPQWISNHDDDEALAVVRRSFHTLKGSGRLLGAEMIGEFSWKFENMLNKIIDKKINVSDTLTHALEEAIAVLPQLIEQLKGNREPIQNIGQLMKCADALAEGQSFSFEEAEQAVETAPAVEAEAPEEVSVAEEPAVDDTVIELEEVVASETADDLEIEAVDVTPTGTETVDLTEEVSLEAAEDELSLDAGEDMEIIVSEEVSSDMPIGDSSDIDISELAPDSAMTSEQIDLGEESSAEEIVELVSDASAAADEISIEETGADEFNIEIDGEAPFTSEELSAADESSDVGEFEIVIGDEKEAGVDVGAAYEAGTQGALDIDPMLLKIYHDESLSHIANVKELFDKSEAEGEALKADKDLLRAFHTLNGSARTAEIDAISELSASAEKYIKARQDGGEEAIPEDVSAVLREIEQSISGMLAKVGEGMLPASNKPLQDKINKILQREIQSQLQRSWQTQASDDQVAVEQMLAEQGQAEQPEEPAVSVTDESDELSVDLSELAPDTDEEVSISDLDVETVEEEPVAEQAAVEELVSEEVAAEEPAAVEPEPEDEPAQMSYSDIDDELIDIFLEEADELLESCEDTLNEIRMAPNSTENIHQLQRNMHTLKGGARMADLTPVGDLTHNLESLVVMVNENKVNADKALFDLLQEALDILTNQLAAVKQRQPLSHATRMNKRIEMMMRGEIEEKRSVERFDVDMQQLESEEGEDVEDIDISALLPGGDHEEAKAVVKAAQESAQEAGEGEEEQKFQRRDSDRPHWGERVTDVNFKDSQEQVRVRSDLLNNLVNYAGEVNIYHARMGKQISDFGFNLSELTQTVIRLKEQLRNLSIETEIQIRSGYEKESDGYDDDFDPLEMDQYSTLQQLTRSLAETAGDVESINEILAEITRDSETLLLQEARISTDLQEGLMRTRMVRFGGLSSRLRRIVRQISRELGKEVELVITGEASEVDRTVLDRIIAPLEHMIRNSVAHGIESPDVRKALGKGETGQITIDVDRQGTNVVIKVKDDGAGINVDKVREKAIKQGFITKDSDVSDQDVLQFILQSGVSTADKVTQVAGRGVGMDVVDSEIKQLGGVLNIGTVHGKGTEFTIRLPLTLAINQALLVAASDDVFAVPLASIEGVVRITGHELQRFYDSGNTHYEFNGVEYELKHLGNLLTGNQPNYTNQLQLFPVLLVNVGEKHFALHVEDLIGRREIVVKPVGLQIGSVHGIAGATILADGRVVLILEMSALVVADSLFKPHVPVEAEEKVVDDHKKTIMVVDDSITIRKITERMLKRYGIDVVLAKDGVDATNQIQESIPDLMLLDIEMPKMDGFEVASYVRNDERLKDIPIIMITSRTGAKHKEKAMEIGVDQYLGKPFQEEELVKDINNILKTSF